jgi:hypothetical protein
MPHPPGRENAEPRTLAAGDLRFLPRVDLCSQLSIVNAMRIPRC